MVLNKRIFREFKENKIRYIGMFFLTLIVSLAVVCCASSGDSIITTVDNFFKDNNIEDGNFEVYTPLSESTINKIKKLNIDLEESFYVDYKLNNTLTIRLLEKRKNINKISITKGHDINSSHDLILDNHVFEANNYNLNDEIKIFNNSFKIVGCGASPDYVAILQNTNDLLANPKTFGLGFISKDAFSKLEHKEYSYIFKLNSARVSELKNILKEDSIVTSFIERENNQRITNYKEDINIDKVVSIILGFACNILVAFMLSVTVIHIVDKESTIIGTLYSLGYVKNEMLHHFMILPTLIISVASTIGTALGFYFNFYMIQSSSNYFSYPNITTSYSPYLILVGAIFPIVIVVIVNYFILSKKLKLSPLSLLRKEKKSKYSKNINLNKFSFVTKYRIREFLREFKSNIVLFFGLLLATYLLVFGFGIRDVCNLYTCNVKNQVSYEHCYILKAPIEVTSHGIIEKSSIKNFSVFYKLSNADMDVVLQGIDENSKFFDFSIPKNDSGLYISNAFSNKFNINIGDVVEFKDAKNDKSYSLKVSGIVDYYIGLYAFMNKNALNNLTNEKANYFNAYISEKPLKIDNKYVYHSLNSSDIIKAAENTIVLMTPTIRFIICISVVLFIIVMYLLLKMMIDKSTFSISLVKTFGYSSKELNKLYLNSSFYTVLVSTIVALPISTFILKAAYPPMVKNMQCFMFVKLKPYTYLNMCLIILLTYLVSYFLLKHHLNKVKLTEILKTRE